jgi:hypothetical protein
VLIRHIEGENNGVAGFAPHIGNGDGIELRHGASARFKCT